MTVSKGMYIHWKGPPYFVTGVGQIDHKGPRIVVYESTQSCTDGMLRLHLESDFEKDAIGDDGRPVIDDQGKPVPRFKRLETDSTQRLVSTSPTPRPNKRPALPLAIKVPAPVMIAELARQVKASPSAVLQFLLVDGRKVNINSKLDVDTAKRVVVHFGHEVDAS